MYVCVGLNYIGQAATENRTEPEFGDFLLVSSIRGPETEKLNLTTTGHLKINQQRFQVMPDEYDFIDPEGRVSFYKKNTFKSIRFRISQSLDVFAHEVQQKDLSHTTNLHPAS